MPGPFEITPSSSTVSLDTKRQGTVTFTVKNTTRMRIRGVARLVATPPISERWYTVLPTAALSNGQPSPVEDPRIRDFAPEETKIYTVALAVEEDAPPGEYRLKLIITNEANPDDDFTESTEVGFSIAPKPPPPPPPKFPIWIIPVILVLLVMIVLAIVLLTRDTTPPPPTETPTPTVTATFTPPPLTPMQLSRLPPRFGRRDIFLGTFSSNTNLTLAVLNFTNIGEFEAGGIDSFGNRCRGFISDNPAFLVNIVSHGSEIFDFDFRSATLPATMLVLDPVGNVHCSDASTAPTVRFGTLITGEYRIWLGNTASNRSINGTLNMHSECQIPFFC